MLPFHGVEKIVSFRNLEVWHLAMDLVDLVIADTRNMPRVEFDLRRQIRRAVISIPSNMADGWRRKRRRNAFLDREKCARTIQLSARVGTMLERLHDSLD